MNLPTVLLLPCNFIVSPRPHSYRNVPKLPPPHMSNHFLYFSPQSSKLLHLIYLVYFTNTTGTGVFDSVIVMGC